MSVELEENDQLEFESLLADKRHKEIYGTLKTIAVNLSNNNDKEVVNAIKSQAENLEGLSKSIREKPVNIDIDTKDFAASILLIRDEIIESNKKVVIAFEAAEKSNIKLTELLENRLLPDTFTLIKVFGGETESVKVNYKPANKIKN